MQHQIAKQIILQPVEALIPYARNSRTHSDEQVAQIAASIREFGFTNPVLVDDDGGIVAGHGRVMAARQIGMTAVPTINVGWLSEQQRRAYVIADNQLAMNAGWDDEALAAELSDLGEAGFDVALVGFSDADMERLLGLTDGGDGGGGATADKPDPGINYQEKFAVLVDCKDEAHQAQVYEALMAKGYACKVLVN
jgi:ParB-like chromosome segregation protein Spo0J